MIDLHNSIKVAKVIAPVDPSATGTLSGTVIDRQGFNSVEFVIANGVITTTGFSLTPVVKSGSATGSLASCAADELIGTEAGAAISGGASDGHVSKIGYIGTDRYVTCDLVVAGAATGDHCVIAILGNPRKGPQDDQTPN